MNRGEGRFVFRTMNTTMRARRPWQALATALALAAFALALAGPQNGVASAGETAKASKAGAVGIDNFAFQPPTLTVGPGSRVVFSNKSGTAHTATRKGAFDTGRIKPGKSASVRFNQKGTFPYHCSIHPFMKGKIVVQ